MSISDEYAVYLEDLFVLSENHPSVSSWENQFLNDTKERYEKYGATMFMSDKQKAILAKINEKVGQ